MTDEARILERLEIFGQQIATRDIAVVDGLWNAKSFILLGSEAGERAASRDELVALFRALFAKPYILAFAWDAPEVTIAGSIGWVTAEGQMRVVHPDREVPMPYRMVAIFEKSDGDWHWRLFSGSEPAPPPV